MTSEVGEEHSSPTPTRHATREPRANFAGSKSRKQSSGVSSEHLPGLSALDHDSRERESADEARRLDRFIKRSQSRQEGVSSSPARHGGGADSSWQKQDKALSSLDQLDTLFDKVLK